MAADQIEAPGEVDVLRFVVRVCAARDDEDLTGQTINEELAAIPEYLHATFLKIAMRVVVAQLYASTAQRLEDEMGQPGFIDTGLYLQGLDNEGLLDGPIIRRE
ncbi:MAG: hypothetical protein JWN52_8077 [Actinomycetia bacterium]|nr:hypothetical protein [Actinomycetes bacterium]